MFSPRTAYRISNKPAAKGAKQFDTSELLTWIDISQENGLNHMLGIGQLDDFSPSTRVWGANSLVNRPTYVANGQNGKAVLRMAANSAFFTTTDAPIVSGPFVAWLVCKTAGTDGIAWGVNTPNSQIRLNYSTGLGMAMYISGGFPVGKAITAAESTAWATYLFVRDSGNMVRFYYNGSDRSPAVLSAVSGSLTLIQFLSVFSVPLACDLGEAGVRLGAVTTAKLNAHGMALGEKWNIPWTVIK